jgi:hypothetical protein
MTAKIAVCLAPIKRTEEVKANLAKLMVSASARTG